MQSIRANRLRSGCHHTVHYYADTFPAATASEFIAAGLRAGEVCVVVLVEPHRRAVEQALRARGVCTEPGACTPGSYLALDTTATLSRLLVESRLDMARAADALTALLSPPAEGGGGRVRLLGDLAPVLFAASNAADAIALEALVDRLAATHGAAVFCAYPVQAFCREGHTQSLYRISAEHASLEFPERLWVQGFLAAEPLVKALPCPAAAGRTRS